MLGEEYELKEIIANSVSKSYEEKGEKMLLIDDTLINNDKDYKIFIRYLIEFYQV